MNTEFYKTKIVMILLVKIHVELKYIAPITCKERDGKGD